MNTLNVMVGNAMMYAGAGGGASIGKFIQSMGTNIGSWVKMIVMIIGVIMVVFIRLQRILSAMARVRRTGLLRFLLLSLVRF